MISGDIWFKMFASCVIVQGQSQSLIYDLDRCEFYELQNNYLDILQMAESMSMVSIKEKFQNQENELLEKFFDQFVAEEIGFYTREPEAFPCIDFTWDSPYLITNAIIELYNEIPFDLSDVINQLDSLGCRAVQIRLLSVFSTEKLKWLLNTVFDEKRIHFIEILVHWHPLINNDELSDLIKTQPRLQRVLVYAATEDKIISNDSKQLDSKIIWVKKDIIMDTKEIILKDRFATNIQLLSEALHFNSGLNRKVCIDHTGDIKNYISHDATFGNVKSIQIAKVIEKMEFQSKWHISNDQIEICQSCQYRYACVSNSDIITENGLYYKKDKCNFDPVSNTWLKN